MLSQPLGVLANTLTTGSRVPPMLESISESYARLRISTSPLKSLYPLESSLVYQEELQVQTKGKLTPENYKFIQRALCNIVLYVRLENKDVDITRITETIIDEASSIHAIGMEYVENIKREEEATYATNKT